MRGWLSASLLLQLLLPAASQAAAWVRLTSSHFELLTDAGEKHGRQVLERLETVRHVFLESAGGKAPKLPVRVFLFSSERDFRRFEPRQPVRGFHQGSAERDYIAVFGPGEEALRAVRHEYMHILLSHGSAALPLWLEEGTAEMYSTVDLRGPSAVFGSPIPNHVGVLRQLDWIGGDTFFNAGKDSPFLEQSHQAGIFYAQAWALAHMLNFSPAWRRHMPRFVELIDQGTPAPFAFESAFGVSPARALADLRTYVRDGRFGTALIPMPPKPVEAAAMAEPLTGGALPLAQVELLLALRRGEEADKLLDTFTGPPSAELETARGLQALARRDSPSAKAHFGAAMKLGAASSVAAFEYAMLLREEHGPKEEVRRLLSEAVGRNPDFAEAHFILGLMAQQENRHRDAVAYFEEATRVLPRQSYFWHARAVSHLELRQTELARRSALRAAASAATSAELEMAQGALKLINAAAPVSPRAGARSTVVVSDSWKPRQGNQSVEGVLEQIDCYGASARFQIRPPATASVRLWVEKPGEVLLQDASSLTFTFACGPQQPRRVLVEYETQPGLPQAAVGRITAIRFL